MDIYVVKPGDSVDKIASMYSVPVERLVYDNQLVYPYRLAVGQALLILSGEPYRNRRSIVSGGYAYPYIEPEVLEETLPYLTEILVFSYGFTQEGNLISPAVDDQWLVDAARRNGVLPKLTLTSIGASGKFENELISVAVREKEVWQKITLQLLEVMEKKGFQGLDIDFEYILPEDRVLFAEFVSRMTTVMNVFGYQVSVALAPKTRADQPGLLYEGKDYKLLGEAANSVLLMTYEWGYTYSEPMAVAPIDKVRSVVQYAVTEILPEKISLGIPNYGYDWALPYVQGQSKAQSIGNVEAVLRAIDFGAEIQFDPIAQTPFYRYWQYGVLHEVWFEDVRSIRAKFSLIAEFGLRGAGYWQLMRLFRANWRMMDFLFQIL